jgi:hypothetical protein
MAAIFQAVMAISYATVKHGKFGEFGELLVNFISQPNPADKMVVRVSPATAKAIAAKLNGGKVGMTVDLALREVDGKAGLRTETFVNKKGETVNQTAIYFGMANTPRYSRLASVNEESNIGDIDVSEEGNLGDI